MVEQRIESTCSQTRRNAVGTCVCRQRSCLRTSEGYSRDFTRNRINTGNSSRYRIFCISNGQGIPISFASVIGFDGHGTLHRNICLVTIFTRLIQVDGIQPPVTRLAEFYLTRSVGSVKLVDTQIGEFKLVVCWIGGTGIRIREGDGSFIVGLAVVEEVACLYREGLPGSQIVRVLNAIYAKVLQQSRRNGQLVGCILDARIAICRWSMIGNGDGMIARFLIVIPEVGRGCTTCNCYLCYNAIPGIGAVEFFVDTRGGAVQVDHL